MEKKIIIGLVGYFGAGKTTVTNYLIKKGFFAVRLSSFLEEELKKRQKIINRKNLQDLGNEFRKKFGPSILAKLAMKKASSYLKVTIDGIRNLTEIAFFKKNKRFYLLGITADPKIRFQRLQKIKKKAFLSWDQFLKLDNRDKGKGQLSSGLQVKKCLSQADYLIENDCALSELYQKVDLFLKSL